MPPLKPFLIKLRQKKGRWEDNGELLPGGKAKPLAQYWSV